MIINIVQLTVAVLICKNQNNVQYINENFWKKQFYVYFKT